MKPKVKGAVLILLGITGIIFGCTFDIIMKKPMNDITGPKSIAGFVISGILIVWGIRLLAKKT